jgi:acyl-CoA thioesterase
VTRSVKAVQNGKIIFMLLCSFQRPEPWQPSHQLSMPPNVPLPDACELEEERMWKLANDPATPERRQVWTDYAAVSECY